MKVLITGSSGTGKSTVIHELGNRGYIAIDADEEPGLSRLEIKETGEPVTWPDGFIDWNYYSWSLKETVLKQLLQKDDTVFLGTISGNQADFYNLFDKIIVLTIPPEEHSRRMQARPRRSANDDQVNIDEHLRKYAIHLQRFLEAGAIPVDSSKSPADTVDVILEKVAYENR